MLKQTVFEQLKTAMKEKDVLAKGVLTLLKSALDIAEKEKGAPLTNEEEIAIVNREIKQTNQSLDGAKQANREDLIEKEQAKLSILKGFLPKQLSEEEIVAVLTDAGIGQGMNMGDAMKIAKPLLTGKADGATISKAVKSLIS
ncbi:GatB/YqeY domain-containing protein [Ureibacillus aquaedulcis]|uniref:GatB/YqeY domain-containing protein n=1 Tax=Ureibacillus aquaedulcis TaxID=3058421 RepID=A0ABT8GMK9_9BACL|nr:GatB/YqeY domain-containing protein [Ureibacillus sp. BA0131]MDN4492642.1 GatB/YqeY domain-containing protein [Ureibacillus sp. BA0131]